jgi:hypothetical protein
MRNPQPWLLSDRQHRVQALLVYANVVEHIRIAYPTDPWETAAYAATCLDNCRAPAADAADYLRRLRDHLRWRRSLAAGSRLVLLGVDPVLVYLGAGPAVIAEERETVINASDADDVVRIWSAQRPVITAVRKSSKFTEIRSGRVDGLEFAEFTIPASQWSPARAAKHKRNMTSEQKEGLG